MLHFFLILLTSLSGFSFELKGEATSLDGAVKIYTERHVITLDEKGLNKKIETKYFNPKGEIFAEMTSDFARNAAIPNVKFHDFRFQKTEELNLDSEQKSIVFKTLIVNKESIEKIIKINPNMAAGQGFDNFVKINFEKLQTSSVPLSFGVLSEMDFFSFKAYKKKETNHVIQFGIELSSFFLRIFSSELVLEYDAETKQILSYRGLSNILTSENKTQDVLIKYNIVKDKVDP